MFGIIPNPNRAYVTVVERNYYETETTLTRGRGKGKVYPAGSYGPWQLVTAKYYPNARNNRCGMAYALRYVADQLVSRYLAEDEANDLRNLADITDRVREEIFTHFKP